MPFLITFRGRPVKRRYRLGGRLRLVMANMAQGEKCDRLDISQAEWTEHGRQQFLLRNEMPDLRELARAAALQLQPATDLEIQK